LDDVGFRALFSGSPIKRLGHERFLRNVLIAIGNSADLGLAPLALERLSSPSALVRGAAVWALARLTPQGDFDALAQKRLADERDRAYSWKWQKRHSPPKNEIAWQMNIALRNQRKAKVTQKVRDARQEAWSASIRRSEPAVRKGVPLSGRRSCGL